MIAKFSAQDILLCNVYKHWYLANVLIIMDRVHNSLPIPIKGNGVIDSPFKAVNWKTKLKIFNDTFNFSGTAVPISIKGNRYYLFSIETYKFQSFMEVMTFDTEHRGRNIKIKIFMHFLKMRQILIFLRFKVAKILILL